MSDAVNDEWNNVVNLFRELRKLLDNCNREAEHSWAIIDKVKRSASIITLELEDLEREISDIIVSNDETSYIGIEPYSDHLLSSLRCKRNIDQVSSHEILEQLEKCEFNIDFDKIGDCNKLDTIKTWNFCCFLDEDSRVSNEQLDIFKNIKAPFYITPQNETPNTVNNLNFVQTLNLDSHPEDVIKSLCSPQKYYETLKISIQNNLDTCLTLIPKKDGELTNDIETIITSNYNSEYVTEIDGDNSESDFSELCITPSSQFFNGDQVVIRNPVYYTSTDPKCCYDYCYEWQMCAPTENYCYNAFTECIDPNCTHTTKGCNIFRSNAPPSNNDEIEKCSSVAQEAKIVKYCEFSNVTVIEGNKTVTGSVKTQIDENNAENDIAYAPSEVKFIATVIPADKTPPGKNQTRIQIPQHTIARPVQKKNETLTKIPSNVAFIPAPVQKPQTPPGYKPPQATPGYRPQQTTPGYKPSQTTPGYKPTQTTPGYKPTQTTPGYKPTQTPPEYKPPQATPGYRPQQTTPGYKPSQTTPGYKPTQTTPGYKPTQTAPGYKPTQTAPGYKPTQTTSGHKLPQATPGYKSPQTTPGYKPTQTSPGYKPTQTTPGHKPPQATPGYKSPQTTPGYKPFQTPTATKSKMHSVPVPQKPNAVPQTRPELQHSIINKPAYLEQERSKVPKITPESIKKESPYNKIEVEQNAENDDLKPRSILAHKNKYSDIKNNGDDESRSKSQSGGRDDAQSRSNIISQNRRYTDPQIHTDEEGSKSRSVCPDDAQPRSNIISQNRRYTDPQIHTDEVRSKSRSVSPDDAQPRSNIISQNRRYTDPQIHTDEERSKSRSGGRNDAQPRSTISQNKGYNDPQIRADEQRSKSRSVCPDEAQPRSNNISQNKGYSDPLFRSDEPGTQSQNLNQDDEQSNCMITTMPLKKGYNDPQIHADEQRTKSRSVCRDDAQPRSNIVSQNKRFTDPQIHTDEERISPSGGRDDAQPKNTISPNKGYNDPQIHADEQRSKSRSVAQPRSNNIISQNKGFTDPQIHTDEERISRRDAQPRSNISPNEGYNDPMFHRDEPGTQSQNLNQDDEQSNCMITTMPLKKGYNDPQIHADEQRTKSRSVCRDNAQPRSNTLSQNKRFTDPQIHTDEERISPSGGRDDAQPKSTRSPNKGYNDPQIHTDEQRSKSRSGGQYDAEPRSTISQGKGYYNDLQIHTDEQRSKSRSGGRYDAEPRSTISQSKGYYNDPQIHTDEQTSKSRSGGQYDAEPRSTISQGKGYYNDPQIHTDEQKSKSRSGGRYDAEPRSTISQGKGYYNDPQIHTDEQRSKSRSVCGENAQPRSNIISEKRFTDLQIYTDKEIHADEERSKSRSGARNDAQPRNTTSPNKGYNDPQIHTDEQKSKSRSGGRYDAEPRSTISQGKGYNDPQIHADEERSIPRSRGRDDAQPRNTTSPNKGYNDPQSHTDEQRSKSRSVCGDDAQPRSNIISQNKRYTDPQIHADEERSIPRSRGRDDAQPRNTTSQNKGYNDTQIHADDKRSNSGSVCGDDAQPRSNISQNKRYSNQPINRDEESRTKSQTGYSNQQDNLQEDYAEDEFYETLLRRKIKNAAESGRSTPDEQRYIVQDEDTYSPGNKPRTVTPTRSSKSKSIISKDKVLPYYSEPLNRNDKQRYNTSKDGYFATPPHKQSGASTSQDIDDVSRRKTEPRKRLVPPTMQDRDDISHRISSKPLKGSGPSTRQDLDDISQRITSSPTRQDLDDISQRITSPTRQNHDDISRRITSPTRHELDEVSQGISSIVDNGNLINKNYSSQMVINKNYFDDDPGGTNGNYQSQFHRSQDQQDRVKEQPTKTGWSSWNPFSTKIVDETESKTQSNKQYIYKISSTSTTELSDSDLRKMKMYQNDKKEGPMAIFKWDLLERSPIIQNKNPNKYHSSTKYEGVNFQIEEIKATVGPDNCATVKLLNADNEVIKTSRVCFSDEVGQQLSNSRGSQTEESTLLRSLHLFSNNKINTVVETRGIKDVLLMNKMLITRTENHAPEISTKFETKNHAPEISTQRETENHTPEISTQCETENHKPEISVQFETENHTPEISTQCETENHTPEISTQCETENHTPEISVQFETENHNNTSDITLKTFDEDIAKPEVDEPPEEKAKYTKDFQISKLQVKVDKKSVLFPSRKMSKVSTKSKESSINGDQQDKKRLNLNSSNTIDPILLAKQTSLYKKHPSISKLRKIVKKFEKNEQLSLEKNQIVNFSKPLSQDSFKPNHKHKNEDYRLKKLKKVAKSISSSQSLLKSKYKKRNNMSTSIDKIIINCNQEQQCDLQKTNLNHQGQQCEGQTNNTRVPSEEISFTSNLRQFFTGFINKNIIPLMSLQNDESSKIEDAKEKLLNMLFSNKNEGFDKLENMPDLNAALNFDYNESILNAKSDLNIVKLAEKEKKDDNQKKKEEKDVQTESERSSEVQSNNETIEIVSLGSSDQSNTSEKTITCCHNELNYLKTIMEVPNDEKYTKTIEIKKPDIQNSKNIESNKNSLKRTGVKVNELKYSFSRKSSKDVSNKYSQHKLGKGITQYSYKKTTIQNYVTPTRSSCVKNNESKWKRITDKKILKNKNIPDELSMYKPKKTKQDSKLKNNNNEPDKEFLKKYYTCGKGYPVSKSSKHLFNKKKISHKKQKNISCNSSNFSFRDYITQQQALCEAEIINILNMLNEKDGEIKNENDLKSDSRYWISNCHIKLLKSIEKLYTNDFESDTNTPNASKFSQNVKEMIRSIESKGKNRFNKNDIKTEHKKDKQSIKNYVNPKKEIQENKKKVTQKGSDLCHSWAQHESNKHNPTEHKKYLKNYIHKNNTFDESKVENNDKLKNEKDVHDQFNMALNELKSGVNFKNNEISVEQNFSCLVTTDVKSFKVKTDTDDKIKKHPKVDSNQNPLQEQNESPKEVNKIKINTKETKKCIEQAIQKHDEKDNKAKLNKKDIETKNGQNIFKRSEIKEKSKKSMEQTFQKVDNPKEVIKTKIKDIKIKNEQNVKIKNIRPEIRKNINKNMDLLHEQSPVKIERKLNKKGIETKNEKNNSKFKNIRSEIKVVKNDAKVSKNLKISNLEQNLDSTDQKCVNKLSNEPKEIITENQNFEVMVEDKPKRVRPPLTVEDFEITEKNKSEISWSSIKQFDSIILKTKSPIQKTEKPNLKKSLEIDLDLQNKISTKSGTFKFLKEDQINLKSDNYVKQKSTVSLKDQNKQLDNELEKMRQTRENYIEKINNALLDYEKQNKSIKLFDGQFPDKNHIKDFDLLCDIHRNENLFKKDYNEIRAHKSYDQLCRKKDYCENFHKNILQKSKSNIELSSPDLSNDCKSCKSTIIDRTVKNINKKLNNMKENNSQFSVKQKRVSKYDKFIDLEEFNKLKITKSQTNISENSKRHNIEDKIKKNVKTKICREDGQNQDTKFQFRESLESIQFWRQLENQQISKTFLNESHKPMNEFKSRHKNIYSGPWAPSLKKETSFEYKKNNTDISSKGDALKQELRNPLVLYNRQFDISSLKREWEIKLKNDQIETITESSTSITEFDIYQKTITKWQMTPSIEEMEKKSMKHSKKIGAKINEQKIHDKKVKDVKKVRKGFTNFTMPVVVPRQQCIVAHSSTLRYFYPDLLSTMAISDQKTYPIKTKKTCEDKKKLKSKIKNSLKIKKSSKEDCERKQEIPSLTLDCLKLNELLKNKKNLSKKTVKSFLKVLQDLSSSVEDHISLMKLALKKENLKLISKYSKSSKYTKEKSKELYKHLISVNKSSKQKMCGDCDAATSTTSPKTMSLPAKYDGQKEIKRSDSKFKVTKTTLEYVYKELITLKSQINQTLFAQVRNEIAVKTSMTKPELDTMLESIDFELDKIKTLEKQIDILIRELKQRIEVEDELDELHTRFEKDFVSKYEYESIKLSQDEALKKLKHETITETKTQLNEKLTEINELIQHQIQEQSRQEKARNNSEISLRKKLEHIGEVLQTELNNIQAVLSGNAADIKENNESIKEEMKSKDYSKRRNMFEKSTSIEEKTKGKSASIEEKPKVSHKTETSPKHGGSVVKAKQSLEEKMNDDLKEKYLKKK